jgi:hemolysin-activating ACP:hemolysin acyltransferase
MTDKKFKQAVKLFSCKEVTSASEIKNILWSVEDDCLEVFYSKYAKPIGFVTWHKMVKESLHYAYNVKGALSNKDHFSQGNIIYINYVLFADAWRYDARRCFIKFLRAHRAIAYVRKNNFGFRVRKNGVYKNRLDLLG